MSGRTVVDKNYYFVLEPNGSDEGPYVLSEIRRRIELGLLSKGVALCRVGETDYVPVTDTRYAKLMEPPRRVANGTQPLVVGAKPAEMPVATGASPVEVVDAKPADTPPTLEALTASINAAATVAAAGSKPIAYPQVIDVAPIAVPSRAAIDGTPSTSQSSTLLSIEVRASGASASDVRAVDVAAIDAVTVETTPVPRVEIDLIDAPTTLDPVSGTVLDAANAFEDVAPTGPFDAIPSMMVDDPPARAPNVEAMPPDFMPPALQPARRLEAPTMSSVSRALEVRAARAQLPLPPPPAAPAPVSKLASLVRSRVPSKTARIAIAGGVVVVAAATVVVATRGGDGVTVKDAMVRVTTPSATGAGFMIDGPDRYVYVATANHVVDRGERVLIERDVGADKHAFVEAFPETEIVASDPDADLAIIRIKNVDKAKFQRLPLAKEPVKDARILSYGYPGSSLAKHAGLVSKDGKVLSLVSFPAFDERYGRIVRENAVEGLLISTDIEPGFSGGPTTNEAGEVVGVNVTKDRAHVGQNGAVSVTALRALVKTIKPAGTQAELKPDDVVALLKKTQSEYLLLPLDERSKVRESEFVNSADLPALRRLVAEVRREEGNTDTSFIAKYKLSGQAALGIYFARLPGKLLETYRAPSTTGPLGLCELRNQHLTSFLGDLTGGADKRDRGERGETVPSPIDSCDELAVRPLAWDLVAATMQWDGKEKDYAVTKLDRMDDEGRVYRASVRMSGAPNLVEIWVGMDRGAARLKLFDPTNNLYAIKSARTVSSTALQGTWTASRPRVTDALNKDAEIESDETLSISIEADRKVSLRYVITERYFSAGARPRAFRCNRKTTIETGLLESFTGTLDNGVVVALPEKEAETIGVDAAYCDPGHRPDRIVAAKLQGTQLVLYRTDGNAYPETVELTKQ